MHKACSGTAEKPHSPCAFNVFHHIDPLVAFGIVAEPEKGSGRRHGFASLPAVLELPSTVATSLRTGRLTATISVAKKGHVVAHKRYDIEQGFLAQSDTWWTIDGSITTKCAGPPDPKNVIMALYPVEEEIIFLDDDSTGVPTKGNKQPRIPGGPSKVCLWWQTKGIAGMHYPCWCCAPWPYSLGLLLPSAATLPRT
jgi:hypothetical protein